MLDITQSRSYKWASISAISLLIAYGYTWCFNGMASFGLIVPDFFIISFYFASFLYSGASWMVYHKVYRQAYVPLCINIGIVLLIALLPSFSLSKVYHKGTYSLKKCNSCGCKADLYTANYCVVGGGFMDTDINAMYLTDLKNFRLYLGDYDTGYERVEIKCNGDKIITTKITNDSDPDILEQHTYSLRELKERHFFD